MTKKTTLWTALGSLAAAVILTTILLQSDETGQEQQSSGATRTAAAVAPLPDQPRIVFARRFEIATSYQHVWHHERPEVDSGFLVVLDAGDRDLRPRQAKEPVLQIGACVVDRINTGEGSGRIVAIVPEVESLVGKPVFYGKPDLPEEMTASKRAAALREAVAFGNGSADERALQSVLSGEILRVDDEYALRLAAIDLVERYAPDEQTLISGWRAPRVR